MSVFVLRMQVLAFFIIQHLQLLGIVLKWLILNRLGNVIQIRVFACIIGQL